VLADAEQRKLDVREIQGGLHERPRARPEVILGGRVACVRVFGAMAERAHSPK